MKKLLKWLVILAAVAAVLFIAAFFTLKVLVPTEKVKSLVQNYAQSTLHREVTFSGVSFNLIGVTLNNVAISEYSSFEQGSFIEVDRAILKIALKPLFKKQIKISTIGLKGLKINLTKDKEGKFNFDDLLTPSDPQAADQDTAEPTENTALPFAVVAEDFYIKNCSIFYKDLQQNQEISVTKLLLDVDGFNLAAPFKATLKFVLHYTEGNNAFELPLNSRFIVHLADLNLSQAYVTLQELTTHYNSMQATFKGGVKNFEQPLINLQANVTGISNKSLAPFVPEETPGFTLPALTFATDIQTDLTASTAHIIQAKLSLAQTSLTATGNANWGGKKATYQIQSTFHIDLSQLSGMSALLGDYSLGGILSGQLNATDKKDGQDIQGTVDIENLKLQYAPVTLSEVKGAVILRSLQDIYSDKITGKLNGENFTTSFTYKDLGTVLDIGWKLNLSKLILDSFATEESDSTSENTSEASASTPTDTPETLFNLNATVNIGEIAIPYFASQGATLDVNLQKASASLKQANGKISFVLREGAITDIMKTIKSYKLVKIILLPLSVVNRVSTKLGVSLFSKNKENAGQIKFQSGSGSYVFTNGLMNIEETHFNSSISDMTAAGNINFKSEAINMQVKASVLTSQTPIIIKIGGTVGEPSGKLDITKTAVSLVEGILNYKTPGKVASSTTKTAVHTTKNVVNTGSKAVTNTVNTATNAVKSIGSLFKKSERKEKEKE